VTYNKASRRHIFIAVLEIAVLVFLVLISIAGAEQLAGAPNYGSNTVDKLDKAHEEDIQTQDKALQRNPLDSDAWRIKGLDLVDLKRFDEAMMANDQAIKINPQDLEA
jgi:tetratricopeptide (TPR) repeat protein